MATENEQIVEDQIVEEDLSKLDDTTDWKAKAEELEQKRREEGIRNRERTKALKEQLKGFQPKPQDKPIDKKIGEIDYALEAYLIANGVKEASRA